MATPQEVLARILAQLQAQTPPVNNVPAPNAPVAQPVTPVGVPPTTTTGLGQAVPGTLDPAGLAELLKQTLAAYQQGGANVGGIYNATTQNFMQPGQNFLLQLIEGLMGQGFTEDQIMSDPSVMGYIQNLNNLLGNTSQNQATDQSWFEKMANLSTAALAQGALLGGGGSGGGGGGGGGGGRGGGGFRRGYGGGGYRRYGGGGSGDGDDLDTKTTGYFQETAKEVMNEYAPGFHAEALNPFPAGSPEATFADRILAAGGTNPRNVRKLTADSLDVLDALLETIEAQRAPAAAQQRQVIERQIQRGTDQGPALRAAAEEAYNRMLSERSRIQAQGGSDLAGPSTMDTIFGTGVKGGISTEFLQNTAPDKEAWIRNWIQGKGRSNLPITGTIGPNIIAKTRYGKQGQIVPAYGVDQYGNPVGQTLKEILAKMQQADWEREVTRKVFDVATSMDPNVSPNVTQRQVVSQGQNKSQQSTWDEDYAIADDILQPADEFQTGVAPGLGGGGRAPVGRYNRNPKITALLAKRALERGTGRKASYADSDVGAVSKGLATGPRKLLYEKGQYRIVEPVADVQKIRPTPPKERRSSVTGSVSKGLGKGGKKVTSKAVSTPRPKATTSPKTYTRAQLDAMLQKKLRQERARKTSGKAAKRV